MAATADLEALLGALLGGGVEFIVVGGVAAVLHGAPTVTVDLDVVHRRTPENIVRLRDVLDRLDAHFRNDLAGRVLRPTASMLSGHGHLNLMTVLGPLDPLCEIDDGKGYDELLPHTVCLPFGEGTLRVLDLPTLLEVKLRTGRAKDLLLVPVLRAMLRSS